MKIINKLKEYRVFLITLLVAVIIFNVRLPYYVMAPGGVIELNKRISINEESKLNGSINMLYVSEYDGTIASLILANVLKEWDIEKIEEQQVANESVKEIHKRNEIMLDNSVQNAIFVAYNAASKEISIKNCENIVLATTLDNDLRINDVILEVNSEKLENIERLKEIISETEVGMVLKLRVLRDDEEIEINTKVVSQDNRKVIGVVAVTNCDYELDPKIDIKFNNSEGGSSGGLMLALSIYDYLSEEDLLKGRKIAGTGTIDISGNVGEIDGVKYKLMGAVKNKVDLVFVPVGNYEEALMVKEKYNYNIEIVEVKTFDDALDYLQKN